jgi:2-oxoacid:acceptor oxidoreductase delta subunit (pyruvate/2-ketoisovalerate family)
VEERIRDFEPAELPAEPAAGTVAAARCFGASTCRACEICVLICPDLCITRDPATQRIVIDLDYCKGCGLCAHHCPKGAIRMEFDR